MLKFSPANSKTQSLANVRAIKPYLKGNRKIYSLDLLSGWSCPFAKDCLSKVHQINKKKRQIKDGPNTVFRCFSATQEAIYPAVYNRRKENFDYLRKLIIRDNISRLDLSHLIESQLPNNLGVLRIHVGGDFFHQTYFDAMALVARRNKNQLFYAYTKSLQMWVSRLGQLTDNFVLTASRGSRLDHLIDEYGLREAVVISDPAICQRVASLKHHNKIPKMGTKFDGMAIDHDDSHAANPKKRNENFALLVHGIQPKGSDASKALSALKGIGSYSKKEKKK